jgi:N-acetylglucosamine kinase-like BadF-type ATPase
MTLVAGIDGGQSSTVAVVTDETLRVLGRGVRGPSDFVDEPADSRRCADACEGAVAAALAAAGYPADTPLAAVAIGLSGYEAAPHGVVPQFGAARVRLLHDAPIALAGAIAQRPGVVVIAGTGSVAYGEDAGGASVRVGGHGYLFGDEGSAFAIARAAIAHALAEADRGAASRIGDAAPAFFNVGDLRAVARAYYEREISRPRLASFARVVLDAARLGDPAANELVESAAHALATLAAVAVERLALGPVAVPVAFTGGLIGSDDLHVRAAKWLAELSPWALPVEPEHEPAVGAARLALDLC